MSRAVDRIVRGWIRQGSGLGSSYVIPGQERPLADDQPQWPSDGVFVTVLPISRTLIGVPRGTAVRFRASYSVQFWTAGAHDAAEAFVEWTALPEATDMLSGTGVAFTGVSAIRNLDGVTSEELWEERAQFDLGVGYVRSLTETAGQFERGVGPDLHVVIDR